MAPATSLVHTPSLTFEAARCCACAPRCSATVGAVCDRPGRSQSAPTATAVRNVLRESSDVIWYNVRRSIRTPQHPVSFVVIDDLLLHRIEAQNATEAIRCIREMDQRC